MPIKSLSGHWFCGCCDDVKFVPAPADTSASDMLERCQDCRNNSLKWVKHITTRRGSVSAYEAALGFRKMREEVAR